MRRSIRRRIVVRFVGFTAILGLVSIGSILWVYHRVEDRLLQQRLEQAIGSGAGRSEVVEFVGSIDEAPAAFGPLLVGAVPGRYEWTLEGREAHALVREGATGELRVAIYSGSEAEARERWFEVGLWSAFVAAFLGALGLARHVAIRAVSPIERLTDRVSSAGLGSLPAALAQGIDDDEVGLLASTLDEAGARLRASIERERRFLREASHELRTPVTVIQGAYDLVAETLGEGDVDNRRRLDRIGRSLRRIDLSLSSLLAMARAEHRAHAAPEEFDRALDDVLEEARSMARPGVEVHAQVRGTPSDPAALPLLVVALSNLLRNAVQRTTTGHVELTLDATRAVVEDTGPGFGDVVLQPAEGAAPHPAFGLGLSTVEHICRRFGWALTLENTPRCAGARVTLRFEKMRPAGGGLE